MKTRATAADIRRDARLIAALGGQTAVAALTKQDRRTVHHWTKRGIPAAVRLARMDLFMPE